MKKLPLILVVILAAMLAIPTNVSAGKRHKDKNHCNKIGGGEIKDSLGNVITHGFDQYGFNYQARIAKRGVEEICRLFRDTPPPPGELPVSYEDCVEAFSESPFKSIEKWNDAWLSNKDCGVLEDDGSYSEPDGALDRHYGFESYMGSGAQQHTLLKFTYTNTEGKSCKVRLYMKINAVPMGANLVGGIWYTSDGREIGLGEWDHLPEWKELAVTIRTFTDPCGEYPGVDYVSPYHPKPKDWKVD